MNFDKKNLSNETLTDLYKSILLPRLIEEKMLNLLRQGKVSKWFSGIGQEAISVGAAKAMEKDEYILPMHRNLGVFTSRNLPLNKLFSQFQGKLNGFSKGRERSFHFGTKEHHIVGMISHLGPQLAVADGIALWYKIKKEEKCSLVFTGEGGTSEGDFHEALNLAAVWELPVIFLIENNGYGLSTPTNEQYRCKNLVDKGIGYGIETKQIEGNNILEVYLTIAEIAKKIRNKPSPFIIEALTFRMRGHEEASGTKYIPKRYFEEWAKKDPVKTYEDYLLKEKIIDENLITSVRDEIKKNIDSEWQVSENEEEVVPDTSKETREIYAPFTQKIIESTCGKTTNKRFVDAISDALRESMKRHDNLIIIGQDIAEYGGVFKVTDGFLSEFGKERIRNTPICESASIGCSLGYTINGGKSIVEMQFGDFISSGFTQTINNVAKINYRWGQNADVVIRMPTGAGVGAGPFHSQSNEAWFTHTPGLKVVYPAFPHDAKGLLNAAIEDPNPVMYFEHKALYRAVSGEVPDDYYTVEIGKANIIQPGTEILVITYGMGVHWAVEITKEFKNNSIEILDLRTLMPWDKETVTNSVKKIGKVIILHEDCLTGGFGGEISAWISENLFEYLDAPIFREGSLDTPVPFANSLEKNFLPKKRFGEKLKWLVNY